MGIYYVLKTNAFELLIGMCWVVGPCLYGWWCICVMLFDCAGSGGTIRLCCSWFGNDHGADNGGAGGGHKWWQ